MTRKKFFCSWRNTYADQPEAHHQKSQNEKHDSDDDQSTYKFGIDQIIPVNGLR